MIVTLCMYKTSCTIISSGNCMSMRTCFEEESGEVEGERGRNES